MKPCKICNKPQDGGYIICAECAEEVMRLKAELIDCYHTQKVVDGQMKQNQRLRGIIEELTARAEKAERERDELKSLCRPVCPVCGLENDRHFQGILCDRCGANLRGPQEEGCRWRKME